jgi:predicted chitinase
LSAPGIHTANFTMTKLIVSLALLVLGVVSVQAALVTFDEFSNAVRTSGYPQPKQEQYNAFSNRLPSGEISNKVEAAMFLSQILWESGGLRYKSELICQKTGCPGVYDSSVGVPGKNYYGRGYIQLTHSYNYKAASLDLFHDLRLINDPDMVANNEDVAWATAAWFWKVQVHSRQGVKDHHFGDATRAVNGMECTGNMPAAHSRWEIYKHVMAAFHNSEQPNEHGCYN